MSATGSPSEAALRARARAHGVSETYEAADGSRRRVSVPALRGVVSALEEGAPPPGLVEPVAIAWDGAPVRLTVHPERAPEGFGVDAVHIVIASEAGEEWRLSLGDCRIEHGDGTVDLLLPVGLPFGAHTVRLSAPGAGPEVVTVLAAPSRLPGPPPSLRRSWGVFAPTYALHDASGAADLGCFERYSEWAGDHGARFVGTLPLLASFLGEPFDPSPYAPVSRQWWNELYVDLSMVPEAEGEMVAPRAGALIDAHALAAARRAVLERALDRLGGARCSAFREYTERRPAVHDYARFRAAIEQHGADRDRWTGVPPDGLPREIDSRRVRYHEYAQFLADEQLSGVATRMRARGQSLLLDLPVGTHRDGFDVFSDPDSFVTGATVGAPPDLFFVDGQDWGFRPPHPDGARRNGYQELREALAQHLRFADVIRVDHVMGLHRLWWVPDGRPASEGVYVGYRAEEVYAAICLEAGRTGASVVGEDLGTVPDEVRHALDHHAIHGMYVAEFSVDGSRRTPLDPPRPRTVASIGTHDTATFAGFWSGTDIDDRVAAGRLGVRAGARERSERAEMRAKLARLLLGDRSGSDPGGDDDTAWAALVGLLEYLARSRADFVLVTLEDLWLEHDPQNIPGTTSDEHASWVRPLALSLEQMASDPFVEESLARLHNLRKGP